MKTIKSEIILLVLLVVIVITIAINCNKKESFTNYFDKDGINNILTSLESPQIPTNQTTNPNNQNGTNGTNGTNQTDGEINITNNITELLTKFNITDNNGLCFQKEGEKYNPNTNSAENCKGTNDIFTSPLMDIDKITNYNNKIRSELDTINFDSEYNNIVGEAINKRLDVISSKLNKNTEKTDIASNESKCLTITNDNKLEFHFCNLLDNQRWIEINDDGTLYKNPFTSKTLKLQETTTNNNYKISNIDNKYDITITKYSIELQDKCYDSSSNDFVDNDLCDSNKLNYYLKPNTAEYTNKFNSAVYDPAFQIDEYNVAMLPKKFFYFKRIGF